MEQEELQQKYLELQMMGEQLKQMQSQLQTIEVKGNEIETNIESLGSLTNFEGSAMLTPIAEGIFLKGELKNTSEVIVNVGAGVCVKKNMADAEKMLRQRQGELKQYATQLAAELEKTAHAAQKLESELNSLKSEV